MIKINLQASGDDVLKKLTDIPFRKKQTRTGHPSTYADDLKLLHELQLQQLEMELQNAQLHADSLSLEELNRKHTELFEFAPNSYFSLCPEGTIREVNLTGANLLGSSKAKLMDQLFVNYILPDDQQTFKICWFNLIETFDHQVFKVRLSRADGRLIYVRMALSLATTKNESRVLLAMTDVTMVWQIEEAQNFLLGCSWAKSGSDFFQALAQYLANSLQMDYVSIDKLSDDCLKSQSMAIYGADQFLEKLSYPIIASAAGKLLEQKSFCIPNDVCHLFPQDQILQKINAESYAGVSIWGSAGKPIGLIGIIGRKPLVDTRLIEMVLKQVSIRAAAELEHRQLEESIIQSRDELEELVRSRTAELEKTNEQLRNQIAQRKEAESILLDSQKHLRQLTKRMDAITEEERIRIAREIHDELGHLLTALKHDIEGLTNQSDLSMDLVKSELEIMVDMIDSLIDSVRKIATELRPGILDHLGLFPAIEWQIRQFRLRTKIGCSFTLSNMDLNFDKNETTIIYRIVQEILTNIIRHSQATQVRVLLTKKNHFFVLKVIDNGVGFHPEGNSKTLSLGLLGMQERALSIGGELHIDSAPGKGTTIKFLLPKMELSPIFLETYS